MLIEIHAIQNHAPSNLNRDDLGAPKTCYFGGVLRSRISSQCIKRSIRMSEQFRALLGGVATRRLAQLISEGQSDSLASERAMNILKICGIAPKDKVKGKNSEEEASEDDKSAGRVFTTRKAVQQMSALLNGNGMSDAKLAAEFAKIIAEEVAAPDMALCGRMLEPKKAKKEKKGKSEDEDQNQDTNEKGVWKGLDLNVDAALQVGHAFSTHEARPEVDYFVAADDVRGEDSGAAFVDEAMFSSACFYKYFSINWELLVRNLHGNEELAAHTVGAFIRAAALSNPTGKQNSFAAHNPPDGILVELKHTPISYANAFAKPASQGSRDIISQSIAQLAQYAHDMDTGYGQPEQRFWFSPNLRNPLTIIQNQKETSLTEQNYKRLDDLVGAVIQCMGQDWEQVQNICVEQEVSI